MTFGRQHDEAPSNTILDAAAEKDGPPADLKVSLDELTQGWRLVDADR